MEASAHSSPSHGGSILTETRLITHASASSGRRAPGAGWMSMPSCAPGPHRCRGGHREFWPEPSLPALHAASRPRASVPGEVLSPPGEKDPAQGTWDPSGKEAWKLVRVIGGVGYLCACVCVCDRQTHSHTHPHTGSLLEISLKGCGRGNTVELGKKLPKRWASWERRHSPEP